MNKEQALQHLYNHVFQSALEERISALEHFYIQNNKRLVEQFIESFRDICLCIQSLQKRGLKDPIGFIHYSMLRTSVLNGTHTYLVEAYSDRWYGDQIECDSRYNAGWAFQDIPSLFQLLEERRKVYMGAIHSADIEYMVLKELPYFCQFVTAIARKAMPDAVQLQEFKEIEKASRLFVRVGEFKDMSEEVILIDQVEKDANLVRLRLMSNQNTTCACENFTGLRLSHINVKEKDLCYADFSGSDLTASVFQACALVGTRWIRCILRHADFSHSLVCDADFRNCDLRESSFYKASDTGAGEGLYRHPGLLGVDFTNANLEGANFAHSAMYGANFHGANLNHAIFLESDRGRFGLSEEQISSICWVS